MSQLKLEDGARVAVIGGGPAGSFLSYFLLDMLQRVGRQVTVDIYEPRDFDKPGPAGCNNCGGIISEWLVQALAADGINLPTDVVERGIDSYVLHTDLGDVRIGTPLHEKRIGAVHRGAGPRGIKDIRFRGFDSFLLQQARRHGANVIRGRVDGVEMRDGRPHLKVQGGDFQGYDLLAVAMGKNNAALKMFDALNIGYKPPRATRTYISEIHLGQETVSQCLGSSMHVFLLNMPRLEFAALIPKGDYATLCLLGDEIDRELVTAFVASPEVTQCLPAGWVMPSDLCHCSPVICIEGAVNPFADRVVFVGDCGVTRLYKDGIGAAYRTAKAAAVTAVFEGIAAEDFRRQYAPLLRDITIDNMFGRAIFMVTRVIQRVSLLRRGVLRTVAGEQRAAGGPRRMSTVLWDTFTGSAPYREVFMRTLHPAFWLRFLWNIAAASVAFTRREVVTAGGRGQEGLGRRYGDGDVIVRQGDVGDDMFVIQAGQVEVVEQHRGKEVRLAVLSAGEFFGEMALVERQVRSATARALGEARVLTVDNRTFQRRVREDPSLAYRILQTMSHRVQELNNAVGEAQTGGALYLAVPDDAATRAGQGVTIDAPGQPRSQVFRPGDVIVRQGESGDCMYVVESGKVEVVQERNGSTVRLAEGGPGDFFGEMAIFQRQERSATVRAVAATRVRVLDKATFLRQVHEDASLAYRMLQKVSQRVRRSNAELARSLPA
jgi:CRP-like cAMP-binding protein/flavin-dependent dehydrogenase